MNAALMVPLDSTVRPPFVGKFKPVRRMDPCDTRGNGVPINNFSLQNPVVLLEGTRLVSRAKSSLAGPKLYTMGLP